MDVFNAVKIGFPYSATLLDAEKRILRKFGETKSIPAPAPLMFRDPSKNIDQWSEAPGGGLIEIRPFRDEVDQGLGLDGSATLEIQGEWT